MGFVDRVKATLGSLLAPAEDPRQAASSTYDQHMELLRKLRTALAEVSSCRDQLALHARRIDQRLPELEERARAALGEGRDDIARLALYQRRSALRQLERLKTQVAEVAEEEGRLAVAEQRLAAQIEGFHAHRDVISARYTAAEAHVRVGEALAGVSQDLADLATALEEAEARTQRLQARAGAIDELVADGVLQGAGGPDGDLREYGLTSLDERHAVESDLETLRREMRATS